MLASINPLGERARSQNYAITVGAYIVGSTVAAGGFGALLGLAGAPIARPNIALALVVGLAAIGLACDARWFGWRVPGPARQVDENWLATYRGWVYGAGFGGQLGFGFVTIVTASATWVAFACALLSGSPLRGAIIGASFGLVRAVPILATARVHDPAALRACVRRLDRGRPVLARITTTTQATMVLVVLGLLAAGGAQ